MAVAGVRADLLLCGRVCVGLALRAGGTGSVCTQMDGWERSGVAVCAASVRPVRTFFPVPCGLEGFICMFYHKEQRLRKTERFKEKQKNCTGGHSGCPPSTVLPLFTYSSDNVLRYRGSSTLWSLDS